MKEGVSKVIFQVFCHIEQSRNVLVINSVHLSTSLKMTT